jgi:hypothetical protein
MAQAFLAAGPPQAHWYCPTTLVKKPIRSKFCTLTGCVVARMDHQCVWLNMTIGYANHRTFLLFLISHTLLIAATLVMFIKYGPNSACNMFKPLSLLFSKLLC